MELINPLEQLQQLEQKISLLMNCIKEERVHNGALREENKILLARLEAVETSLLKESRSIEELNQERVLTKLAVDELISSIDKLVEEQRSPAQ